MTAVLHSGWASCLLVGLVGAVVAGQDVEGSKDHPLISRYPGSTIEMYSQKEFDEFTLPLSAVADGKYDKAQHLEGRVTGIYYLSPQNRSTLEIFRNYAGALKSAGFQTLYTCAKTCGDVPPSHSWISDDAFGNYSTDGAYYLAAKLSRTEGDVCVALWVYDPGGGYGIKSYLVVIESKPMETGLVTVNATSLAGDITRTGHASVYGILFETGKADVKPESDATLKEIAKLLQQNAALKLYVVGHTDNQGTLDMNMDLSRRRAQAVMAALTTKYGLPGARLAAFGDGPYAPVASNDAEEGRAKNRRVELVKQ
jgi:OOP family OmpA-OmpF porin